MAPNMLLQYDRSSCIVQKFGGTSIGKFPLNIVQNVIRPSAAYERVVVVCSARSCSSKSEGTTERLLRAYRSALVPQSTHYRTAIQSVRSEHIRAAQAYVKALSIIRRLIQEIVEDCGLALRLLERVHTTGEASMETLDALICVGEKLACRFMSAILRDQGVSSEFVDFSDEFEFPVDRMINRDFYDRLATMMARRLSASNATVPVVTGCFGRLPGGLLARIGRGYTDLCASLLSIGMQARELQIWKEVEGFYTADPRKVPTAKLLSTISPGEASELTYNGSEIIHFVAMGQAMHSRIPIRVKNVMNPLAAGSIVQPDVLPSKLSFADDLARDSQREKRHSSLRSRALKGGPSAMTSKERLIVINVFSEERYLRPSFISDIVTVLAERQVPIDLLCTSQVQMSMAIRLEAPLMTDEGEEDFGMIHQDLVGAVRQLQKIGRVKVLHHMAIITLVGKDMKGSSGSAGRIFSVLGDNDVNIEMIAQGASETSISCVVEENDVDRAMNLLHASLFGDGGAV